jgi:hypothetical protein
MPPNRSRSQQRRQREPHSKVRSSGLLSGRPIFLAARLPTLEGRCHLRGSAMICPPDGQRRLFRAAIIASDIRGARLHPLIEALQPWLDQVVVFGGRAHRIYPMHPLALLLEHAALATFHVDIAGIDFGFDRGQELPAPCPSCTGYLFHNSIVPCQIQPFEAT